MLRCQDVAVIREAGRQAGGSINQRSVGVCRGTGESDANVAAETGAGAAKINSLGGKGRASDGGDVGYKSDGNSVTVSSAVAGVQQ